MWDLPKLVREVRNLKTAASVHTRWVVLTGEPSSGKSTVLTRLSLMGYQTRTEVAREHILSLRSQGISLPVSTSEKAHFTRSIVSRSRLIAEKSDPEQLIIFDRSLTDVLAFALVDGLDVAPLLLDCLKYRFARAFLFERASFRNDGTIYHNSAQINDVGRACEEVYAALGCPIVRVPLLSDDPIASIAARAIFVRNEIAAVDHSLPKV